MTSRRFLITAIVLATIAVACRPGRFRISAPPPPQDSAEPTRVLASTLPPSQTPAPRTPAPTFDFPSYLLTQAYANHTPRTTATAFPQPSSTLHPPHLTPIASSPAPFPSALFVAEPIVLPNAVNTADCKISNFGDCSATMLRGVTVFLQFKFGMRGSEPFSWGSAAVVVTRDGQPFKWIQVNNGLRPPIEDENSILFVGEVAEFQAGVDNIQPGQYTARLALCPLNVAECNEGKGWQNVGGDSINFVITP